MIGADLVVYLWFLPVTLSIIVPLAMLVVWSVGQVLKPLFTRRTTSETQEERAIEPTGCMPAQA